MVKKLRIKFILLSMGSLAVLLAAVVTGMNLINYFSVITDSDAVLALLSQNDGRFPDMKKEPRPDDMPKRMTGETPYESRFFSVILDPDGNTVLTDTSRIAAISGDTAEKYAKEIYSAKKTSGFYGIYRYSVRETGKDHRITFLDCRRALDSFRYFRAASILMAISGLAAVFIIITILSGRIIQPISESYEKQKRFITDAGHEIRTPLSVINANAELLEGDLGENECVEDIRKQTKRLAALTEKLVYLTRMEESGHRTNVAEFSVSELVSDMLPAFTHLALSRGRELTADIHEDLTMRGDENAVGQLFSVLLDNAVKYSQDGGTVSVSLRRQGRHVCFTVTNPTGNDMDKNDLARLFDRFYRADKSRNSETGGYGIGLSIAKAVTDAHGGKIKADFSDGTFRISVTLPV